MVNWSARHVLLRRNTQTHPKAGGAASQASGDTYARVMVSNTCSTVNPFRTRLQEIKDKHRVSRLLQLQMVDTITESCEGQSTVGCAFCIRLDRLRLLQLRGVFTMSPPSIRK